MWNFNEFNIGDIVVHNETPHLEFQVRNVLRTDPDSKGDYLYSCWITEQGHNDHGKEYKYHESDLFLIRKGTRDELETILLKVIEREDYELAQVIRDLLI